MKTGAFVGIPLTLCQLWVHSNTGVPIDVNQCVENALVGVAVYDADRIRGPLWIRERRPSQLAFVASSAYFASFDQFPWLLLTMTWLHFGYTRSKPTIAPAKPFVVSSLWTLFVFYIPAWRAHSDATFSTMELAAFFLAILL